KTSGLPTLAPPLLRQFASVGNNLNQIARKINSGQWSGHDRVHGVNFPAPPVERGREQSEQKTICDTYNNGLTCHHS
ncbi:MobC family plasmid mobilization relaxosome protein, partial [Escherichia coli]|uniref:MobC family plasmid mobilization relaxosome protein n=1 Tax=Escherichia coli TaxID=562 RepID=UPI00398C31A1